METTSQRGSGRAPHAVPPTEAAHGHTRPPNPTGHIVPGLCSPTSPAVPGRGGEDRDEMLLRDVGTTLSPHGRGVSGTGAAAGSLGRSPPWTHSLA